ncbi:NAD-P-binding protein [Mycena alexandri]|uniref:NAD-P-binding protein n=1 Tax=Mycena alexandri TaxID=1745969 RepID=A0AAD6SPN7_9AGAR|nr:NAD-P-binding protein [Mycena alexandri]
MSFPTFTISTTAEEVATAFAKEIQGKNVLITGTSMNGLGFENARVIARHANLVIITGYNTERLKLSEEAIKKEVPSANIRPLTLDLSSLAAVRKAAAEVNAYPEPIHVVIHNAAATIGPFKATVDGFESQMATAHLGPFLFTKLIAPKILAAGTASYTPRVVFVSSSAHRMGPAIDLESIGKPNSTTYTAFLGYFHAKAAQILTAIELSKRSQGKINAYSLSPGAVSTNINQKEESKADMIAAGILTPEGLPSSKFHWKTIPEGAATTMIAAFDPRLAATPGVYLQDAVVANDQVAPHASDLDTAAKLWTITETVVGETFSF